MTELRKDIYCERGRTVFTDANEHCPATIIDNYKLIREVLQDQVAPNTTSIFDVFMARLKLSKTEENIITLYFFANRSYEEIALRTGLSVARVQRLKDAAIRKLRELLA